MKERYYVLDLNPEPWAVGEVSVGRKDGQHIGRISPNPNLAAYQNAVREALEDVDKLLPGKYKLTFLFWRQQARYIDAADRIRQRNRADATNLQKGLEDALQGVLFDNDRDVADIRSVIVEQGTRVKRPAIVIKAELIDNWPVASLPGDVVEQLSRCGRKVEATEEDQWSSSEELF